jgi:hypothetical protein
MSPPPILTPSKSDSFLKNAENSLSLPTSTLMTISESTPDLIQEESLQSQRIQKEQLPSNVSVHNMYSAQFTRRHRHATQQFSSQTTTMDSTRKSSIGSSEFSSSIRSRYVDPFASSRSGITTTTSAHTKSIHFDPLYMKSTTTSLQTPMNPHSNESIFVPQKDSTSSSSDLYDYYSSLSEAKLYHHIEKDPSEDKVIPSSTLSQPSPSYLEDRL